MPELPEVETTCRGVRPHLLNETIERVDVLDPRLRWPVSPQIGELQQATVTTVERRAKYLLLSHSAGIGSAGTIIVHLGMSGSLRICEPTVELRRHDHVVMYLGSGKQLRYHDPRRFGCWLWTDQDPRLHTLLRKLGPEPLSENFHARHLASACEGRKTAIKQVIMDNHVVVGVGNIYACEALFAAGIHPRRAAGRVAAKRLAALVVAIRAVLERSIEQGGTTLRDFLREDDRPGYFKQQLTVYDRAGQPCRLCKTPIERITLGQRSTYFCPKCQR